MAMGSSSASQAMVLAFILGCSLLIHCKVAESKNYTVGDDKGWAFKVSTWPEGKTFRAGDYLVFKYDPSVHNVFQVKATGYKNCNVSRALKNFKSGNDHIKLPSNGTYFFICSIKGHCEYGMKINVTVLPKY